MSVPMVILNNFAGKKLSVYHEDCVRKRAQTRQVELAYKTLFISFGVCEVVQII